MKEECLGFNVGVKSMAFLGFFADFYVYKISLSDNTGGVLVENVEKQICEWIPLLNELNILVFERVQHCCQYFQLEVVVTKYVMDLY